MESVAADLAQRLAERAEAVCHYYLPNGVRRGALLDCRRRVRRQRPKSVCPSSSLIQYSCRKICGRRDG